MSEESDNRRLEHELAVEELAGTALQGRVALLTGTEEEVAPLLADAAVQLADSTEVARMDAMSGHTASALVQALVVPLGIEPDQIVAELRQRGKTLPLALVVENGECLGSKALAALRALMAKSDGGLGLVIGGDGELQDLLGQAGISVACHHQAQGIAEASEHAAPDVAAGNGRWYSMLPWKHLAAVAGLLVLVLLFWPHGGEPERQRGQARELTLPEPRANAKAARPEAAGKNTTREAAAKPDSQPSLSPPPPAEPDQEPQPEPQAEPQAEPVKEDGGQAEAAGTLSAGEKPELSGLDAELGYRREDWLLARGDGEWMLQLTLAASEDRARSVLDQVGRQRGAYYRSRRAGEQVYIVLSGPYGSREEALGARAALPRAIRTAGPFPRAVDSIREEISADG